MASKWEAGVWSGLGFLGTGVSSLARDCSADGSVVVGVSDTTSGISHAIRWQNGTMIDINTPPWVSSGDSAVAHFRRRPLQLGDVLRDRRSDAGRRGLLEGIPDAGSQQRMGRRGASAACCPRLIERHVPWLAAPRRFLWLLSSVSRRRPGPSSIWRPPYEPRHRLGRRPPPEL